MKLCMYIMPQMIISTVYFIHPPISNTNIDTSQIVEVITSISFECLNWSSSNLVRNPCHMRHFENANTTIEAAQILDVEAISTLISRIWNNYNLLMGLLHLHCDKFSYQNKINITSHFQTTKRSCHVAIYKSVKLLWISKGARHFKNFVSYWNIGSGGDFVTINCIITWAILVP
jgi:hypothetical protein